MKILEKISVIIPVYNVEEFLEECILSVINQTYKNLEIILINDGSTDKSGYICDEYKKKDSRIKVIHKSNTGVSNTRNIGIDKATGIYLMFIDSDDYIELDTCEVLKNYMEKEKSDIVICSHYRKKHKKRKKIIKNYDSREGIKQILLQKDLETSPCGRLFRKSLFKNIYFPEKIKIGEDLATIYRIFDKANKITFISDEKYFYRIRKNSAMTSKFDKKKMDVYSVFEEFNVFLLKKYPDLVPYLKNREIKTYIHYLISMYANNYKEIEDIRKLQHEIKKHVLKYVIFNKNTNLFIKIFGLGFYINFNITKNIIIFLKKLKGKKC